MLFAVIIVYIEEEETLFMQRKYRVLIVIISEDFYLKNSLSLTHCVSAFILQFHVAANNTDRKYTQVKL